MKRLAFSAGLLFASFWAAAPVGADGGFFPHVLGEAGDLAQTRQEVLLAFYSVLPSADDCADAEPLSPRDGYYSGATFGASNYSPNSCGASGSSPAVWYSYTPATDGEMRVQVYWRHREDPNDIPAELLISVHSGCPGDDGVLLACPSSELHLQHMQSVTLDQPVVAGTRYLIRIADKRGSRREFLLQLSGPATEADEVAGNAVPFATYALRSRYVGEPGTFAWVVPAPATPTGVVAHESGALFDYLGEQTRPRFVSYDFGLGLGDEGAPPAPDGEASGTELVEVEAQGEAGIFSWAALTSTGSEALLEWLNQNDFTIPLEADEVLDPYIQSGWHFLAIRVREPDAVEVNEEDEIEIPPIQFTCQTSQRVYPMAISQVSAADETEVLIYVLANHRVEAANLLNGLIDREAVIYDPTSPSETSYESVFAQTIQGLGGTALITECVSRQGWFALNDLKGVWAARPPGACSGWTLTRMRTVLLRSQMDLDFEFQDAADNTLISREYWVYPAQDTDQDGVLDHRDECADTPEDDIVNTDGCSCAQIECDDGLFCNGPEHCDGGECMTVDVPVCGSDRFCDEDVDACVECLGDAHCADGFFCNGTETCIDGDCVSGVGPCTVDALCNEELDVCIDCLSDAHCEDDDPCTIDYCVVGSCASIPLPCQDGLFCNGVERCINGECVAGESPCGPDGFCDETQDICGQVPWPADPTPCVGNADCEDGVFCNGAERCVDNTCASGPAPCSAGETCDEVNGTCLRAGSMCGVMGSGCGPTGPTVGLILFGLFAFRFVRTH